MGEVGEKDIQRCMSFLLFVQNGTKEKANTHTHSNSWWEMENVIFSEKLPEVMTIQYN